MQITSLFLQNFRSLELYKIDFSSKINILYGHNNAGKTTVLEALYFCSNLKSFKALSNSDLINTKSHAFKLSLSFLENHLNNNIFVEKSLKSSKCLYNEKKINKNNLTLSFPCYSLVFGFNNILLNDSSYRRDFIDSGMFHVEPSSRQPYDAYTKVIKQRNFLLKTQKITDLNFWNNELLKVNDVLHNHRYNYFLKIQEHFLNNIQYLKDHMPDLYNEISSLEISYEKGWTSNEFEQELISRQHKDMSLGYTSVGTHRSDIIVKSENKLVKESSSMSTLVLSCLLLYLAKISVFHVKHKFKPLLLIDDLFFGIDNKNLKTVIKLLVYSNSNIVMTAPNIYKDLLEEISISDKEISLIHVGEK